MTNVGTFYPFQNPHTGWGINGLNQNAQLGLTGLNPNAGWNTGSTLIYGTALNQNPYLNQANTPVLVVPTFGPQLGELAQGITANGTHVAIVPNHAHLSGGSLFAGNPLLQGITSGAPVVGISSGLQGGFQAGFQGGQQTLSGFGQSLATELSENNNEYVISFDVPGIDIEDLDVSLSGSTILINGIRKGSHDASTLAYSEVARGSLSRAIAVPFDVSPNKAINTSLENGVLKIRIAKDSQTEKKLTGRKVKIG